MKKRQLTTKKPPSERIIKDIRTLRDSGKADTEIRALLGIELRTYQRYTKRIHEEDQKVWYSITQEQMETELLRLKSSLEETYNITKQTALDPECEDRIEALHCKDDARLSIVHLLSEYPDFIRPLEESTSQYVTNVTAPSKPTTLQRLYTPLKNKEPTIIFSKKYEEPELYLHCKEHPGCRMVRLADGLRCQICGGTNVATRTAITFNNPSAQEPVI
jgi:hypothetical protein